MKEQNPKEERNPKERELIAYAHRVARRHIGVAALLLALSVILCAVVSYSWFAANSNDSFDNAPSSGKVVYALDGSSSSVFYAAFDDDSGDSGYTEDTYEPDYDDDGNPIYTRATGIRIEEEGGTEIVPFHAFPGGTGSYSYELAAYTGVRLVTTLSPSNTSDKITWVSDTPGHVTVNRYGRIYAAGEVGSSATVTATVTTRQPDATGEAAASYTVSFTVTVGEGEEGDYYNFLPPGVNILRAPETAGLSALRVKNHSTVASKLRVGISWKYEDYKGYVSDAPRYPYTPEQLLADYTGTALPLNLAPPATAAPFSMTFDSGGGEGFSCVSASNPGAPGSLYFRDTDGCTWWVSKLSLTDSEKVRWDAYIAALNAGDANAFFGCTNQMIDEATAWYYYGAATSDADYGTAIPAAADPENGDALNLLQAMTVNETYVSFSSRAVMTVTIRVQARQAGWFPVDGAVADGWYDVATVSP